MADHAKQSVDYIKNSGQFVCRPKRRIFVEHEIYSPDGKVVRKATRQDIQDIAENNNEAALGGNPAKMTIGHTVDDTFDKDGNVVKRFREEDQPAPKGFYLNYITEEIKDGKDAGKLALYADNWVQKHMTDDKGNVVDGPAYAATFPGRSAEYLRRKRLIDSVALLRRTPALDLGIDILPYQAAHPERVFYSADGAIACVEDSKGKWRYAYEDDMDTPPSSPAAPADDRAPATPAAPQVADDGWTPEHQHFAEQSIGKTCGMHHSHAKALMGHLHKQHGAALGLPPDMMTPHGGPAGAVPGATADPASPAGAAPAAPASPATPRPGAPMRPETERMHADQDALERQRYSQRLATVESELAQYRQRASDAEDRAMYAAFEGQLKQLYMEGRDSINVAKEVETCKSRKYSQQQLDWHIEALRRIPPGETIVTGGMIPVLESQRPVGSSEETADRYSDNPERAYKRSLEVQRYARQSGKSMEDANKWWVETHLNGTASH